MVVEKEIIYVKTTYNLLSSVPKARKESRAFSVIRKWKLAIGLSRACRTQLCLPFPLFKDRTIRSWFACRRVNERGIEHREVESETEKENGKIYIKSQRVLAVISVYCTGQSHYTLMCIAWYMEPEGFSSSFHLLYRRLWRLSFAFKYAKVGGRV